MTKFFIILFTIALVLIVLMFLMGLYSTSKTAPGLIDGQLAKCPKSPNCVCSLYPDDDKHAITPIMIGERDPASVWQGAKKAVIDMGGEITSETDHYLAATFTSKVFKFVDDLELVLDPSDKTIHIRSASRVGYGDGGVNKQRADALRQAVNHENKQAN